MRQHDEQIGDEQISTSALELIANALATQSCFSLQNLHYHNFLKFVLLIFKMHSWSNSKRSDILITTAFFEINF